jgi:NAD-dependent SIR2 family protein deacetylase
MIKIKCKKCGWTLPFSSKATNDSVQDRGGGNIICPKCGELVIERTILGVKKFSLKKD